MHDRPCPVLPRHFDRPAAGEDNDDIAAHGGKRRQQLKLIFRQTHIAAVDALGLAALVKAEEQQNGLGSHRKLAGLGAQPRAASAATAIARLEADYAHALRPERIEGVVDPCRIHE